MAKLEWSKSFETGIDLIDAQHRELIKRIDALDLAIYGGTARTELVRMQRTCLIARGINPARQDAGSS